MEPILRGGIPGLELASTPTMPSRWPASVLCGGQGFEGKGVKNLWLLAHDPWGTEAPRTRLAAGPLCTLRSVSTLTCSDSALELIRWSAGPAF